MVGFMRILIKNGLLLLSDGKSFRVCRGSIVIEDNLISECIPDDEAGGAQAFGGAKAAGNPQANGGFDRVLDASDALVMPGLINAHTHAYMSLFRNYADDREFFDWLHSVEVVEDEMSGEDCYWATMLSAAEMIRTGTTCFVDMCLRSSKDGVKSGPKGAVSGAVNDSGMRAFLSRGLVGESDDEGSLRRLNEFLADKHLNEGSDRIKFILGPHAPYSCGQSILKLIRETGFRENLMATIHISESEEENA